MLAYIALMIVSPMVLSCLFIVAAGLVLLKLELRLGDELIPGVSIAYLITEALNNYRDFMMRMMFLMSLPGGVTPDDLEVVANQWWQPAQPRASAPSQEVADSRAAAAAAPAAVARSGNAAPRSPGGRLRAFDEAVRWLRQPKLALDLATQLRLRAVYLQATFGDAATAVAAAGQSSPARSGAIVPSGCLQGTLGKLQLQEWTSLKGTPQKVARAQLLPSLCEADPAFAATTRQPVAQKAGGATSPVVAVAETRVGRAFADLAGKKRATLVGVVLQLMERRLPVSLEQVFRWIFRAVGIGATAGAIALGNLALQRWQHRRSLRYARAQLGGPPPIVYRSVVEQLQLVLRKWPTGGAAAVGVLALYSCALAHGLPAWLHAFLLQHFPRLWGRLLSKQPQARLGDAAVARLQQRLLRTFRPGVSRSIFAEDEELFGQ
eukprot:TRINITY_DN126204_c0_g1_i1.p1 TRINITY_DN126204_c0_g1~~TRINITY_DN126204_c0_g1_i1.p1  ORF type:complete len:509 (-),score=103.94 TRINITY_DN126204_c0_g1_i1:53-1357(-)